MLKSSSGKEQKELQMMSQMSISRLIHAYSIICFASEMSVNLCTRVIFYVTLHRFMLLNTIILPYLEACSSALNTSLSKSFSHLRLMLAISQ